MRRLYATTFVLIRPGKEGRELIILDSRGLRILLKSSSVRETCHQTIYGTVVVNRYLHFLRVAVGLLSTSCSHERSSIYSGVSASSGSHEANFEERHHSPWRWSAAETIANRFDVGVVLQSVV